VTVAIIVMRATCGRQPGRRGDPDASQALKAVHPTGRDCQRRCDDLASAQLAATPSLLTLLCLSPAGSSPSVEIVPYRLLLRQVW